MLRGESKVTPYFVDIAHNNKTVSQELVIEMVAEKEKEAETGEKQKGEEI